MVDSETNNGQRTLKYCSECQNHQNILCIFIKRLVRKALNKNLFVALLALAFSGRMLSGKNSRISAAIFVREQCGATINQFAYVLRDISAAAGRHLCGRRQQRGVGRGRGFCWVRWSGRWAPGVAAGGSETLQETAVLVWWARTRTWMKNSTVTEAHSEHSEEKKIWYLSWIKLILTLPLTLQSYPRVLHVYEGWEVKLTDCLAVPTTDFQTHIFNRR